ncbi:MAG: flagellar motor protein MotB [Desulfobacteraceae bacterium]|jgi:chemotaxis protein MotB
MQKNEKGDKAEKKVVIKKINKGGHGGHHGGAWKVAYADFVTGMMAFFLLMWLISMSSPDQKNHLAGYFKEFSLFDESGMSDSASTSTKIPPEHMSATLGDSAKDNELTSDEQVAEMVNKAIEKKLQEMKDQIIVEVFDQGVRIEALNRDNKPLFDSGSSTPTRLGRKVMSELGLAVKDINNKIAIEGHTDAVKYSGDKYTNWELATDRASMARRILHDSGISPDRIERVSGFASSKPLKNTDAYDPKNRRISIILYNENAYDLQSKK